MNENDLPADVRKMVAEALRLAEAERRAQPEAVPVEREYDGESGLANLKEVFSEVLSEAGIVPGAKPPKPSGAKKPSVNQRMAEMFQADPGLISWAATKWATKLGCTDGAVKQTRTWELIQTARAMAKAERTMGEP